MKNFKITNRTSSLDLGIYQGDSEEEAYQAMMSDAGYTKAEAQEWWGVEGDEDFIFTEV